MRIHAWVLKNSKLSMLLEKEMIMVEPPNIHFPNVPIILLFLQSTANFSNATHRRKQQDKQAIMHPNKCLF